MKTVILKAVLHLAISLKDKDAMRKYLGQIAFTKGTVEGSLGLESLSFSSVVQPPSLRVCTLNDRQTDILLRDPRAGQR